MLRTRNRRPRRISNGAATVGVEAGCVRGYAEWVVVVCRSGACLLKRVSIGEAIQHTHFRTDALHLEVGMPI